MSDTSIQFQTAEAKKSVFTLIFAASIALMNRLTYAWKFVLIGVLLVLPIGYVTQAQWSGATEQLDFNAKESIGVAYIHPSRLMLAAMERYRVYAVAVAQGDASFKKDIADAVTEADARQVDVDQADKLYGDDETLRTTARWGEVKALWAKAKTGKFKDAEEADTVIGAATSAMSDLILNYAGNYSNLILDPDLDSYWLMDLYIIKLPSMGEFVARAATQGLVPQVDTGKAFDRNLELAGLYKLIASTVSDTESIDLATAYKYNEEKGNKILKSKIQTPFEAFKQRLNSYADLEKSLYIATKTTPTAADNHNAVVQAIEAIRQNHAFWDAVEPQLDQLCQARVVRYAGQRTRGLIVAIFAALVLSYLFAGFYFAVRESVAGLARATNLMIEGTNERFVLAARDEVGDVANRFNQINGALLEVRGLKEQTERDNRELQNNIMELLQVVSNASDGDLTVRAHISAGALGNVADAFNQHLEALQGLIGEVSKQVDRNSKSVSAISKASEEMAAGATRQTNEVVATQRQVESITQEIAKVSEVAETAAGAAKRTQATANDGAKAVENVIGGMGTLRTNVQSGAKKMKNLGDRSMEITSIVGTISRISEQTNMLALNAAIEAARAGEHGRGFSVVAEEVRKLAERTATATQDIDKLVKTIHQETNETVEAIDQQTQIVEQESSLVAEAGESLTRIRQVSAESAELVGTITKVAKAQAEGANTVAKSMVQVSEIARATQRGAQATLESTTDLITSSQKLTESIRRFKIA